MSDRVLFIVFLVAAVALGVFLFAPQKAEFTPTLQGGPSGGATSVAK